LGVVAPPAQRLPGDRLGAGGRPGIAALKIATLGVVGVLDRRGEIGTGKGGV
jgi:hypothetical protein